MFKVCVSLHERTELFFFHKGISLHENYSCLFIVLVGPAELKTVNRLTGIEVAPSQPPDTSSVVVKLESDTTETKVDISKDDTDDIAHVVDKTDKEQNKENEISTKWNDDKTEVKGNDLFSAAFNLLNCNSFQSHTKKIIYRKYLDNFLRMIKYK